MYSFLKLSCFHSPSIFSAVKQRVGLDAPNPFASYSIPSSSLQKLKQQYHLNFLVLPLPGFLVSQKPSRRSQLRATSHQPPIEVEVKLRLRDAASHQKVSHLLSPFHIKTLLQENIFFDGADSELTSKLAVLRIRFYNVEKCVLSLKTKPVISGGISRVEEHEEPFDPATGRACVAEPWRLLSVESSEILKRVRAEYKVGGKGLVCLGGFRNVRAVYEWKGLKLELDETKYDFGTSYEIECETGDPETHKELLQEFLQENGINYSYSELSKFHVFQTRKLPE